MALDENDKKFISDQVLMLKNEISLLKAQMLASGTINKTKLTRNPILNKALQEQRDKNAGFKVVKTDASGNALPCYCSKKGTFAGKFNCPQHGMVE